MPALKAFGVFWHIASDDVPVFAGFAAAFHAAWILAITGTGSSVLNMPHRCHQQGYAYIATVLGLLGCFLWGFVLEMLLVHEGSKARPCCPT